MTNHHIARTRLVLILFCAALAFAAGAGRSSAQAPQAPPPAAAATLDSILKALVAYDGGIGSEATWKLRDYVNARRDDPAARADCEAKLLIFLKTTTSPIARMVVARNLRTIASDQAVPWLAVMLTDEHAADAAIYLLQQIPGQTAEKALLQAVPTAAFPTKTALIAALGERRDPAAVPVLVPLLQQPAAAKAAAYSLGKIGGDAAATALMSARSAAPADVKPAVNAALLQCAEMAAASNDLGGALKIYDALAAEASLPPPMRRAAVIGRINAAGPRAASTLVDLLGSPDAVAQEAAIARLRDIVPDDGIGPVCALLPKLPEGTQVAVLAALAKYPAARVLPAVLERARSSAMPVRLAALKTLESVGGASEVQMLAQLASQTKGPEQAAARATLGALHGSDVDAAIIGQLGQAPDSAIVTELMAAVGERRIFTAKPLLTAALTSPVAAVRSQALKSLRTIGTPSDMPAVLDLLVATADDNEQAEAEKTIAALGQKIASADGRSRFMRPRLSREKVPEVQARLIGVLPLLGDNSALPAVRSALADTNPAVRDAAVRALAAWPTPAAREDLLALARDARNETHRLLAITGLVRVIGLETWRDPQAAVADLRTTAGFAWRPEEHKLVLGALAQFPCQDAIALASSFLNDPVVNAEAKAALEKLAAPSRRR